LALLTVASTGGAGRLLRLREFWYAAEGSLHQLLPPNHSIRYRPAAQRIGAASRDRTRRFQARRGSREAGSAHDLGQERDSTVKSHKKADEVLAEKAAMLVTRLIEKPGKRAENTARRWALQSPRHMLEILKTICTVNNLDGLGVLATEPPEPSPLRGNTCRGRKPLSARQAALSSRIPREGMFAAGDRSAVKADRADRAAVPDQVPASGISKRRQRCG
jgi:hypothetical protein